jgi:hypothetical protein
MQRFKAALTTGNWKDNPEPLARDSKGEFVKYEDVQELIKALQEELDNAEGSDDYIGCDTYIQAVRVCKGIINKYGFKQP